MSFRPTPAASSGLAGASPSQSLSHRTREGEAPSEPAKAIAAQQELRPPKCGPPNSGGRGSVRAGKGHRGSAGASPSQNLGQRTLGGRAWADGRLASSESWNAAHTGCLRCAGCRPTPHPSPLPTGEGASLPDRTRLGCPPFFGPPHKGDYHEHPNRTIIISLSSPMGPPSVAGRAELFRRCVAQ